LRAGVFGVGPAAADAPLVSVNDNPAAPKIGMAFLRCEACFTRDISILPDKRGHSIQQVMRQRGDATGGSAKNIRNEPIQAESVIERRPRGSSFWVAFILAGVVITGASLMHERIKCGIFLFERK
jgi:hypothetical protein